MGFFVGVTMGKGRRSQPHRVQSAGGHGAIAAQHLGLGDQGVEQMKMHAGAPNAPDRRRRCAPLTVVCGGKLPQQQRRLALALRAGAGQQVDHRLQRALRQNLPLDVLVFGGGILEFFGQWQLPRRQGLYARGRPCESLSHPLTWLECTRLPMTPTAS